jgi:hemerythrin superfamily protein
MAQDAVTLIKNDHRLMERLFARLKAGDGDRRELVAEAQARLTAHARAEEAEVYPVIAEAAAEKDDVAHGADEHLEAERKLRKVRHLIDSPHFEPAVDDFVAAVAHHVREEESELLPALREATDEQTLERLGAAFERVRLDELATSGYEAAPAATELGELAEATRDDLYEKAREADIPGRSRMKKDDLIEALREQR